MLGHREDAYRRLANRQRIVTQESAADKRLREVDAYDVLLLEVPMPVVGASVKQRKAIEHLKTAQSYFVDGHYTACVAACREVFDVLEIKASSLRQFASQLDQMSKDERASGMFAAIRHYTHPAHHAGTQQVLAVFDRSDAKLLLHLAAATVSYEVRSQ